MTDKNATGTSGSSTPPWVRYVSRRTPSGGPLRSDAKFRAEDVHLYADTAQLALVQPPKRYRRGRQTLIRRVSTGGTRDFLARLTQRGRGLSCSVDTVIIGACPPSATERERVRP
jgi:hypothetical protein